MLTHDIRRAFARRSFLARLGAGATAFGAVLTARPSEAQAPPPAAPTGSPLASPWLPARHATDDWFDRLPGKHRFFFDTLSADGIGDALHFASNYFTANKSGYGLEDGDLAVVIGLRHHSTPFAYGDALWAAHGELLAERAAFTDPKTSKPPTLNVYQSSAYGPLLLNGGVTLDGLTKRGAHFSVCQLTTRAMAGAIAKKTERKAEDVYQEMVASLGPNFHVMPAGIIAVNRAQERGYSFVFGG